ncbi:PH1570 family protein [Pyrococcus yayanosii]|uniref:PH1570-like domain-containing protein n=1 Tax=Pyrococcus yayanosii (strain CH1 / JCM 16557) TaxID=529709 RepID=F8AGZ0_PYRYC|nr:PH1570 family protein [Pyrococcus yayanosii]AEH24048.1 hypothetical protein PYCH_03530 [Pyrococcus yayanosii CH1]
MQCEEKLEVFENGFEDGKFNIRVEVYGGDARKVLLALIYELYLPDYGSDYIYPFECAKEFWGIYMDGSEVEPEEMKLSEPKFVSRSVIDKLDKVLKGLDAPQEVKALVDLERAKIYKVKEGYLAVGKNFLLDHRDRLFIFNKPSVAEMLLKYIGRW